MDALTIDGKNINVSELSIKDAAKCNLEILIDINSILECYKDWSKSTFELSIEKPKLFYKLISLATGESKKYIKSLKPKDYDALVFTFLSVNAEFFIQRLKLIQLSK